MTESRLTFHIFIYVPLTYLYTKLVFPDPIFIKTLLPTLPMTIKSIFTIITLILLKITKNKYNYKENFVISNEWYNRKIIL